MTGDSGVERVPACRKTEWHRKIIPATTDRITHIWQSSAPLKAQFKHLSSASHIIYSKICVYSTNSVIYTRTCTDASGAIILCTGNAGPHLAVRILYPKSRSLLIELDGKSSIQFRERKQKPRMNKLYLLDAFLYIIYNSPAQKTCS